VSDYDEQVRGYLAYCKRAAREMEAAGSALDAQYHPTADGACKLIPHNSVKAEAAKIRQAFREITGGVTP
jgi:hypothetical protein